jgi:pimeloyl-ACP methyl ester carboxylesterase
VSPAELTQKYAFRIEDPEEPERIIRGWIEHPTGANEKLPHVILVHGFKGFMDWGFFPELSRRIALRNMVAVRFNMSGSGVGEDPLTFGDPEGFARNTCSRELEDLERVREWIAGSTRDSAHRGDHGDLEAIRRAIDPERALLWGHSRGGAIALLHASEHPDCRAVVTWAAVATLDRFDEATKAAWRRQGQIFIHNYRTGDDHRIDLDALEDLESNRARLDVRAACSRLRTPALLVHGAADETVPIEEFESLAAAIPPELRQTLRIPGAGHTLGVEHPMRSIPAAFERAAEACLGMLERHAT